MRKFLVGVGILIFATLSIPIGQWWTGVEAQAPPTEYKFGIRVEVSCDPVTTDILGNPEIVPIYEFAAFPETADLSAGKDPAPISPAFQVEVSNPPPARIACMCPSFMVTVANGTKCKISVRAMDGAGNRSDWANPISGIWDGTKPTKPGSPGCKLLQ